MTLFANLVKFVAGFLTSISANYNEAIIQEGLQECAKGIKRIRNAMRQAHSIGEKQHLEACLRNIISLRNQLKAEQKTGAGNRPEGVRERVRWDDTLSAFSSRITTGLITNLRHKEPKEFLADCKAIFKRRIKVALRKDAAIKVNAVFCGEFVITKGDMNIVEYKYFTTSNSPIYRGDDINMWFDEKITTPITTELEEFAERDSGWALKRVMNLGININRFNPLLGSSYIDLPQQIKRKEACINVRNDDQACFAWSIVAALFPVNKDPQRMSKYPHPSDVLNLKSITMPMTMKQIPRFEKQNEVSTNVYILGYRTYTDALCVLATKKNYYSDGGGGTSSPICDKTF